MIRPVSLYLIVGTALFGFGCDATKAGSPIAPAPADTSKAKDTAKVPTDTSTVPKDTTKTPVVPVATPTDSITGPAQDTGNGRPTVTTIALTLITRSTVKSGGEILSDGGSPVLHKGMVMSKRPHPIVDSPDIYDSETDCGDGNQPFSLEMQGLQPGTTFYIRSFATNSVGTSYGPEHKFTTTALTSVPGSCSPEANTIDFNHEHNLFYSVIASTRDNTYGNFTLSASASRVDVDIEFLQTPVPGIYTTVGWDAMRLKSTEVKVNGVFGSQYYMAAEGDTVKVGKSADGKFSATFCSLHFSSGSTTFDFTTGGNLTEK